MKLINNVPFDRKDYKDTLKALGMKHDPPDVPYYIDVETDTGATPLMLACAQAEVSSVEKLLENGAKKVRNIYIYEYIYGHPSILTTLTGFGE